MLGIKEWAIGEIEGEIPRRLRVVLIDSEDARHEFSVSPLQGHRLSDELLTGVAKIVPRRGVGE